MKKNEKNFYRQATSLDIPLIWNLEEQIFADSWNLQQLEDHLNNMGEIYIVENSSKQILAYLLLKGVVDEWEIYRIAVHPSYRRMGIGKDLLCYFLNNHEFTYSSISIFLEVRQSNSARFFYEELGFKVLGERKKYYSDGEDCILYRLEYTKS